MKRMRLIFLVSFFIGFSSLYGQDLTEVASQVRISLEANNFAAAQALLGTYALEYPWKSADVGELYTEAGLTEYERRNFRNAYTAFREALKLQPTNQTAAQYYLRMRREMDIAALANEYVPPAPPTLVQVSPAEDQTAPPAEDLTPPPPPAEDRTARPAEDQAVQPAEDRTVRPAEDQTVQPAENLTPPPPPPTDGDLEILIEQLKAAQDRLNSIEGSTSSSQAENELLRQQLESQRQLMERMLSTPRTAPVPSAAENAELNETVRLLSQILERDPNQQIVVQSDPALQTLVERLAEAGERSGRMTTMDFVLLGVLSLVGLLVIGLVIVLLAAFRRARRRNSGIYESSQNGPAVQAGSSTIIGYGPSGASRTDTPLLDFIDTAPEDGQNREIGLRRDLLKVERLNRMYEDVRSGGLSWNTVRKYIGELELSLRSEILSTVERKLDEGDMLSKESILPVVMPFLSDYNDFIREKSESLVRRALAYGDGPGAVGADEGRFVHGSESQDPLSVESLMDIPGKLQEVFKKQDPTLMTAKISRGIGAVLGLTPDDRNLLYKSALIHDCGYLQLDRDRLIRIISKLEIDGDDFKLIQSHTVLGLSYFGEVKLPDDMKGAIRSHHERNDGSGYPDGLKKEAIPLFAKIIGIAETFSALISKRAYRDKRDPEQALMIISDGARSKFDAAHVEALRKVVYSTGTF